MFGCYHVTMWCCSLVKHLKKMHENISTSYIITVLMSKTCMLNWQLHNIPSKHFAGFLQMISQQVRGGGNRRRGETTAGFNPAELNCRFLALAVKGAASYSFRRARPCHILRPDWQRTPRRPPRSRRNVCFARDVAPSAVESRSFFSVLMYVCI